MLPQDMGKEMEMRQMSTIAGLFWQFMGWLCGCVPDTWQTNFPAAIRPARFLFLYKWSEIKRQLLTKARESHVVTGSVTSPSSLTLIIVIKADARVWAVNLVQRQMLLTPFTRTGVKKARIKGHKAGQLQRSLWSLGVTRTPNNLCLTAETPRVHNNQKFLVTC